MSRHYRYLALAAQVSRLKHDERHFFLGAVGIRSDSVIVSSYNGPSPSPDRTQHAEYRLSKKLSKGSVVYVARTLADGSLANARPCFDCLKVLKGKKVQCVIYSVSSCEYGTITL